MVLTLTAKVMGNTLVIILKDTKIIDNSDFCAYFEGKNDGNHSFLAKRFFPRLRNLFFREKKTARVGLKTARAGLNVKQ